MSRAFVIRPFNTKPTASGEELNFEWVHEELIAPALRDAGFSGSTTEEIATPGNIRDDMFALIVEADLVICDITIHNANVFYELGMRQALRKRHTILIRGKPVPDSPPFDVQTDRYLAYDIHNPAAAKAQLIRTIQAALSSNNETDSPVFRSLLGLPDIATHKIQLLPQDFLAEVERARSAKAKGWLRLLAQDLSDRRFQWLGLEVVANAQWEVGDYPGARENYEAIREMYRDNVNVSLALANIYERLYRMEQRPELLVMSDQAIERVIAMNDAPLDKRTEAMALKGRNRKTRWRQEFVTLETTDKRREAAINPALRQSYEAYRDAFFQNLNHFWSGLAALQMGSIFLDLCAGSNGSWKFMFDDDDTAVTYHREVANNVEALKVIVPASIKAALRRLNPADPEYIWAEISKVDLSLLMEPNEQRLISQYKVAIPRNAWFAWDAVKGQLALLVALGIKADVARNVIMALDLEYQPPVPDKPVHVLLFVGHRIDAPDRIEKRFPAEKESRAKELIRNALRDLDGDYRLVSMASAAPGSDILFHEVCSELGIPSTLCLPMPKDDYVRLALNNLDDWRSRFLQLLESKQPVLELSSRAGLPHWLYGGKADPWERAHRWIMQMALTLGAAKITLLTLWDGKPKGDAPGGTAHMVQLARNSGTVHVKIIDAKQLLE